MKTVDLSGITDINKKREILYKIILIESNLEFDPYNITLSRINSGDQHVEELRKIDESLNRYRKDLKEVFSDNEIFIIKNRLYQKADLRCQFRDMRGFLPDEKMQILLDLEAKTSIDRGERLIKIIEEKKRNAKNSLGEYIDKAKKGNSQDINNQRVRQSGMEYNKIPRSKYRLVR